MPIFAETNLDTAMKESDNKAKGFFICFNDVTLLERLTAEEKGRLFDALVDYAMNGKAPNCDDRYWEYVFNTFAKRIDSYYKKMNLVAPVPEPKIEVKQPEPTPAPKIYERPVETPQFRLDAPFRPSPKDVETIDSELALSKKDFACLKAYSKAN